MTNINDIRALLAHMIIDDPDSLNDSDTFDAETLASMHCAELRDDTDQILDHFYLLNLLDDNRIDAAFNATLDLMRAHADDLYDFALHLITTLRRYS